VLLFWGDVAMLNPNLAAQLIQLDSAGEEGVFVLPITPFSFVIVFGWVDTGAFIHLLKVPNTKLLIMESLK
jgi:hypothetical protein